MDENGEDKMVKQIHRQKHTGTGFTAVMPEVSEVACWGGGSEVRLAGTHWA